MKLPFGCILLMFSFLSFEYSFAQKAGSDSKVPEMMEHDKVKILNCKGINTSKYSEFSPAYFIRGLVYVSDSVRIGGIDKKTGNYYYELLYSELNSQGMPKSESYNYSKTLSSKYHEGPISFSRDFDRIYFSRNALNPNTKEPDPEGEFVTMKIYTAERGERGWKNVRELPFNVNEYKTLHPSIGGETRRLYFSSNRPGGYGGMDIWYMEIAKNDSIFGDPINAGPRINTPDHEAFPYIHVSGVLFYASKRAGGMGGFDIYMASNLETNPRIRNLGPPFNSEKDDFGLILNDEGTEGFFSSNRLGGIENDDDIYKFILEEDLLEEDRSVYPVTVTVIDQETDAPLPDAKVRVFENTEEGLLLGSNVYDIEVVPSPIDPNRIEIKLTKKSGDETLPPTLTDEDGEYKTSMERGKEYVVFVTKKGYQAKKLDYTMTAGEEQNIVVPLVDMNCLPIVGIVREGESMNRLSDVVIDVKNHCDDTSDKYISDDDGTFNFCLDCDCAFTLTLQKEGYKEATQEIPQIDCSESYPVELILTKADKINQDVLQDESVLYDDEKLEEGALILLEHIYYDYDKATIRPGAAQALDQLAVVMEKYPDMEIVLIAHTDSRGSTAYNLDLSKRRAENARRYLIRKGIDGDRIIAVGRGEKQLRNDCADGVPCTEAEHQKNRRTELKILYLGEKVNLEVQENEPEVIDARGKK